MTIIRFGKQKKALATGQGETLKAAMQDAQGRYKRSRGTFVVVRRTKNRAA